MIDHNAPSAMALPPKSAIAAPIDKEIPIHNFVTQPAVATGSVAPKSATAALTPKEIPVHNFVIQPAVATGSETPKTATAALTPKEIPVNTFVTYPAVVHKKRVTPAQKAPVTMLSAKTKGLSLPIPLVGRLEGYAAFKVLTQGSVVAVVLDQRLPDMAMIAALCEETEVNAISGQVAPRKHRRADHSFKTKGISLPLHIIERLEAFAKVRGYTQSRVVTLLLDENLPTAQAIAAMREPAPGAFSAPQARRKAA